MYILLLIAFILIISVILNKIVWKQEITLIEMAINLVIILLMLAIFWIYSYNMKVKDTEILNGHITNKNKYVTSCIHSYSCNCRVSCSQSSQGGCRRICRTCFMHPYDLQYVIATNIGNFHISNVDLQGLIEPSHYNKAKIGDPVAKKHRYNNYIKGSNNSIFSSKLNSTEIAKFPKYPDKIYDYYKIERMMDEANIFSTIELQENNKKLSEMLKNVGFKKQVNVVYIITKKNEDYALKLFEHWFGGKKSDVIIIIGIDNINVIKYVRINSWSLHNIFNIQLRDAIKDTNILNMNNIISITQQELEKNYVTRSFKEFEYLKWQIVPTANATFAFTILCLIVSTIIGYYMSKNNIEEIIKNLFFKRKNLNPFTRIDL